MADYKKVIELELKTSGAKSELKKLTKEVDKLKNVKVNFGSNSTKSAKQDIKELTTETDKLAKAAHNAALAFVGMTNEQSKLSKLKDVVDRNKAKLSPEDTAKAEAALKGRQDMLDEIASKSESLQLADLLGDQKQKDKLQKELNELSAKYKDESGLTKQKSGMNKALASSGKFLEKQLSNAIKKVGAFFVDTFKNSFKGLSQMATMNASSTLISNASARQQQLVFGLTGGQNYAMTNAMQMLGMQSVEDLLWANPEQMAMYREISSRLEAQYNQLEQSGIFRTVQEFQIDMAMMKMQFQNTIYEFIAQHKNEIEAVLKASLNFMSWVLDLLGKLVGFFAGIHGNAYTGVDTASVSSVTNSSVNDNSIANTVTVNYTNNEAQNGQAEAISSAVLEKIVTTLRG